MAIQFIPTNYPPMDPIYQFLLANRRASENAPPLPLFTSIAAFKPSLGLKPAPETFINVVAEVENLEAWKAHAAAKGAQLDAEIQGDNRWIVTARIPFFSFAELLPFTRSLKVAPDIVPTLNDTIREIGLIPSNKIPSSVLAQGGKHVIVGIVDEGCDFAHRNFIKPTKNKTRIYSIWKHAEDPKDDQKFTEANINKALRSPDPYTALGYQLKQRGNTPPDLSISAHGTHVMDIATGNGSNPGVAPRAKIIFVELTKKSQRLVKAVRYIFDEAEKLNLPCVVNLSLSNDYGPHDDTGNEVKAFDDMLEKPNRAIVISAGNSFDKRTHFSGTVSQDKFVDIQWIVPPFGIANPTKVNSLGVWYSENDEFNIEIIDKDRNSLKLSAFNPNAENLVQKGILIGQIYHYFDPMNNSDKKTWKFFKIQVNSYKSIAGVWTLRVHGSKIITEGKFHSWCYGSSTFQNPDPNHTISCLATGHKTIVVGSYDAHQANTPISNFSSAGPTIDGRFKPEVSAPGHLVLAANSLTRTGLVKKSGTSMAAPAVTGLVARILGQAYAKKVNLTIDQIRKALISTCRRNPPKGQDWDSRYGYGRVYADSMLAFSSFGNVPGTSSAKETIPPGSTPPPSSSAAALMPKSKANLAEPAMPTPFQALPGIKAYEPPIPSNPNIQWLKNTASSGSTKSMITLGNCCYHGTGIAKSYPEAIKWYTAAANKKDTEAAAQLGLCFQHGLGVPKNEDEALKWYESIHGAVLRNNAYISIFQLVFPFYWHLAQKGIASAQFRVGLCCFQGHDVPKNFETALYWFMKAADQGHAQAQFYLAILHYQGYGTDKDPTEALYWFMQAANQGDEMAKRYVISITQQIQALANQGTNTSSTNISKPVESSSRDARAKASPAQDPDISSRLSSLTVDEVNIPDFPPGSTLPAPPTNGIQIGLANLGNTCWANSFLQFISCTNFYDQILTDPPPAGAEKLQKLLRHIVISLRNGNAVTEPLLRAFLQEVGKEISGLEIGTQIDAPEFFLALLRVLRWEPANMKGQEIQRMNASGIFPRLSVLYQAKEPLPPGYTKYPYIENFQTQIEVTIKNQHQDLDLAELIADETIRIIRPDPIDNTNTAPVKDSSFKTVSYFITLPNTIMVYLKRGVREGLSRRKVDLPIRLNQNNQISLTRYEPQIERNARGEEIVADLLPVEECRYQIGAAVVHIGDNIEGGHYTCYERTRNGTMLVHDDTHLLLHTSSNDFGVQGYFLRLDRVDTTAPVVTGSAPRVSIVETAPVSSTNKPIPPQHTPPPIDKSTHVAPVKTLPGEDDYQNGMRCFLSSDPNNMGYQHFRAGALKGHPGAQYRLGLYLDLGTNGTPRNLPEAVRWITLSAEQGYLEAQQWLAGNYVTGDKIQKSIPDAIKWFQKAAAQGDANSQRWLKSLQSGTSAQQPNSKPAPKFGGRPK